MDIWIYGLVVGTLNVTVIGAGNSGLAMAAHLSLAGNKVTLWNRSLDNISKLIQTRTIRCSGVMQGSIEVHSVTNNLDDAVSNADIVLITTPATSHRSLAEKLGHSLKRETLIVLNPGRTFGALEFLGIIETNNNKHKHRIAETQTIVYTCRKTGVDSVNVIALKSQVLISTFNPRENRSIIEAFPKAIQQYFVPARSMVETSIGNVGMILHCAPLLLNTGWTESKSSIYKYYYDGITPSVGTLLEKIDKERVLVSKKLGYEVETTKQWLERTYGVSGQDLYECIQENEAYRTIEAPSTLNHRYIMEDVPCGLVPLESIGIKLGIQMKYTGLIIDMASSLLEIDFRKTGRHLDSLEPMDCHGMVLSM